MPFFVVRCFCCSLIIQAVLFLCSPDWFLITLYIFSVLGQWHDIIFYIKIVQGFQHEVFTLDLSMHSLV